MSGYMMSGSTAPNCYAQPRVVYLQVTDTRAPRPPHPGRARAIGGLGRRERQAAAGMGEAKIVVVYTTLLETYPRGIFIG